MLDAQRRLIEYVELCRNTVTRAAVHRRRLLSLWRAMRRRRSWCKPSFRIAEPSRADEHLAQTLKAALALVDMRVLITWSWRATTWSLSPNRAALKKWGAKPACFDQTSYMDLSSELVMLNRNLRLISRINWRISK